MTSRWSPVWLRHHTGPCLGRHVRRAQREHEPTPKSGTPQHDPWTSIHHALITNSICSLCIGEAAVKPRWIGIRRVGVVGDMGRAQDGLTEYERQREEHIARNKARMDALNLPDLSTKVTPTRRQAAHRPTSSRGLEMGRRRKGLGGGRLGGGVGGDWSWTGCVPCRRLSFGCILSLFEFANAGPVLCYVV